MGKTGVTRWAIRRYIKVFTREFHRLHWILLTFVSSFIYTSPIFPISEPDGIRLITSDICDFVQKVPAPTVSIFRPGSTSSSAILFDAWESLNKKSPKADENIRSIRPELAKAVDECIEAAGREWEPYWQRQLLNVGPRKWQG